MREKYHELSSDYEIKQELSEMGVDVFEPESRSEEEIARAFDGFSHFVLDQERDACLEILENDLRRGGGSVGQLQGGSDDYSIYRVSFPADDCDGGYDDDRDGKSDNAALRLLDRYNGRDGRTTGKFALTTGRIERYMLGMCDRRGGERGVGKCSGLGNLMLIMQFGGPTDGQVRHIDNMVPNVQVCTYMSARCPSTIVYAMDDGDGSPVVDGASLIEFWEGQQKFVPELVKDILLRFGDRKLKSKWHTKYFAWNTINLHLLCFGKLYQPVAYQLGLLTKPGTTLLAGGNEIHAGPPTSESRMFAFAIGIPDDDPRGDGPSRGDEDNDGEVQYSPVLLHVDFCCLLFSILDHECAGDADEDSIRESKRFLVDVLLALIRDCPTRDYLIQIAEDRLGVRAWLESVLTSVENGESTDGLAEEAVRSDKILYSPDVMKRRSKKKKKARTKNSNKIK